MGTRKRNIGHPVSYSTSPLWPFETDTFPNQRLGQFCETGGIGHVSTPPPPVVCLVCFFRREFVLVKAWFFGFLSFACFVWSCALLFCSASPGVVVGWVTASGWDTCVCCGSAPPRSVLRQHARTQCCSSSRFLLSALGRGLGHTSFWRGVCWSGWQLVVGDQVFTPWF